jgi:shikimate dehydrogenase
VVTHRAAVLGMPIEHSLSPVLHTAAYAELGLAGWDYGRYAVDEAGLPGFVAGLGPEWVGLSLTMPLKRVALEVADEVTPDAAAIGAANTLVRRGGEPGREPTIPRGPGWLAMNTDVVGIEQALRAVGVTAVESAVVVGAGGTAQAALAALRGLGETARRCSCATRPGPVRCATPRSASAWCPGSSAGSRTRRSRPRTS